MTRYRTPGLDPDHLCPKLAVCSLMVLCKSEFPSYQIGIEIVPSACRGNSGADMRLALDAEHK